MGRRLAFLIGNQSFGPGAGLADLSGPHNDVNALAAVLRDPERGDFTTSVFLDRPRGEVLPALDEALNDCGHGDFVVLYYAGHGKLDPGGRLCLATGETRANALYSTSIPAGELRNLISNSHCDQVLLLLDCCYSGAAGRDFTRGGVDDQLALMQEAQGLHVLTASTGYQSARELDRGADGVVMGQFTRAIVEGVGSGAADLDHDGLISLSDLRNHLRQVLRGQTPQYWAQDAAGDPMIARAGPVETPAQKRSRRLGAWYAAGRIDDDRYGAMVEAVSDQGDERLAALLVRLLDNPRTTPEGLIGAWDGAIRPPPQEPKRPSPSFHAPPGESHDAAPAEPQWQKLLRTASSTLAAGPGSTKAELLGLITPFVPGRPAPSPDAPPGEKPAEVKSAQLSWPPAPGSLVAGLRFRLADWIALIIPVGLVAILQQSSSGHTYPDALFGFTVFVALVIVVVKLVRRGVERLRGKPWP
jgi:hypothetical protein